MTLIAHAGFCVLGVWCAQEIAERRHASILFWSTTAALVYVLAVILFDVSPWKGAAAALMFGVGLQFVVGQAAFSSRSRWVRVERDLDRWVIDWRIARRRRQLEAEALANPTGIVPFDKDVATGHMGELAAAVAAERWDDADAVYRGVGQGERSALAGRLDNVAPLAVATRWATARPASAVARLALAHAHFAAGLASRTGAVATMVTAEGWQGFHHHLLRAMPLTDALLRDPDTMVDGSTLRIRLKVGLGNDVDDMWPDFVRAVSNVRDHMEAHMAMLTALAPKWHGSEPELRDFVKRSLANAPAGSPLWGLVPASMIELWISNRDVDTEILLDGMPVDASEAVAAAFSRLRESWPESPSYDHLFAMGCFAYFFFLINNRALLAPAMQALDGWMDSYPWFYGKDESIFHFHPDHAYRAARILAGL